MRAVNFEEWHTTSLQDDESRDLACWHDVVPQNNPFCSVFAAEWSSLKSVSDQEAVTETQK